MGKFKEASSRLEAAVKRLEDLLADSGTNMAGQVASLGKKLEVIEKEHDSLSDDFDKIRLTNEKLHATLREAKKKNAAMQVVNEAVAERIDLTIKNLKRVVGGS